ncbi:polysaccharide biosynthesis/export family protein [uncultured Hyphomonas sp.]|uniref:polysaccharide biosynthesis/export family protein n=1 Tax=uncultured Hyphomonas sp. TaxID=225298 RepID=UPI000C3FAEB1|nr:polysaccharide biosynthesis protein [Hyphomonadaceae bacterium]MBA28457.1 polysaccharide biosynthesis protein [Hyphomonadaceae bacterium]MBL4878521.1 polysaccharide export protein [Hyphomonas sp.]
MMTLRSICTALMAGAFLLVSACQAGTAIQRSDAPDTSYEQRTAPAYVLGNGDRLRVTVFGHPDLSGEFDVDGSGAISLPLVGQIEALGLTTPQLETKIVETLDGDYILNPRVSAEVINYRPYYILGEVGSPGEYPYNSGLTVLNAVAAAGGFTYRANKKVVFIKSVDTGSEETYTLDTNTAVKPGDTIRIGERIF